MIASAVILLVVSVVGVVFLTVVVLPGVNADLDHAKELAEFCRQQLEAHRKQQRLSSLHGNGSEGK
jgi:pyruvate-formate lyase-activating enzyme